MPYSQGVPDRLQPAMLSDEVVADLRTALGNEHVCTSDEELRRFSRCTISWDSRCAAVIFPGSAMMLLHRMNRILEVNDASAYAVIEPGVSYERFNARLKSNDHKLWVDCTDATAQSSVIGNALDRGVGETPYGDHFGSLCGLEVVPPARACASAAATTGRESGIGTSGAFDYIMRGLSGGPALASSLWRDYG